MGKTTRAQIFVIITGGEDERYCLSLKESGSKMTLPGCTPAAGELSFDAACRAFAEATGRTLPAGCVGDKYFQYDDARTITRVYYATAGPQLLELLGIPEEEEMEPKKTGGRVVWVPGWDFFEEDNIYDMYEDDAAQALGILRLAG